MRTLTQKLSTESKNRKAGFSQEAITRRLSPLEKTAAVAESKSTHSYGEGLTPEDVYEELKSREVDRIMNYGTP